MPKISKYTEVEIDVDLEEIVEDLSARERDELSRLLDGGAKRGNADYVMRAYESLTAGRGPEALAYLESYLYPSGRLKMREAA